MRTVVESRKHYDARCGATALHSALQFGGDIDYNVVTFGTEFLSDPDPTLLRYDLFKPALLAIAEAFAVQRAYAYPRTLCKLWPPPGTPSGFPIAWISYVGPRAAPS